MREALQEIKSFSGVTGAFVFSSTQGLVSSNLPEKFNHEDLEGLAKNFIGVLPLSTSADYPLSSLEIGMEDGQLFTQVIDENAVLFVFCEARANLALLRISAEVIAAQLREALAQGAPIEEQLNPKAAQPVQAPAPPQPVKEPALQKPTPQPQASKYPTLEELKTNPELSSGLFFIQKGLFISIGPTSRALLNETVGKWAVSGPTTKQRLKDLVLMLLESISDQQSKYRFHTEMYRILKG